MYLIVRDGEEGLDFFGPFPSEKRAYQYAESFSEGTIFKVVPIIVPNCVTVTLNY